MCKIYIIQLYIMHLLIMINKLIFVIKCLLVWDGSLLHKTLFYLLFFNKYEIRKKEYISNWL